MFSSQWHQTIKASLNHVLGWGLQCACGLCERSSSQEFCPDCWRQLMGCRIPAPLATTAQYPPLLAWGRYQGSLKRAIARMKYQHQTQIASRLGEELGLQWLRQFPQHSSCAVIPIPLHRDRLAERGYNQAELIARRFSQVVGGNFIPDGLMRVQQTQAQHRLNPAHRTQNLKGAFAANRQVLRHGKRPVLIIDDIFTTGATTLEAIQVLQRLDIPVLGVAVIAQAVFDESWL